MVLEHSLSTNKPPHQLQLFVSEADEALDIVAELIHQLGHIGCTEHIYQMEQTKRHYLPLMEHPAFKAAEERRRQRYWKIIERAAKEVDSWPDWKKGVPMKRD